MRLHPDLVGSCFVQRTDASITAENSLRLQTQSILESHLRPILSNDYALAIASQQWAQGVGTLSKSNYAGYSSGGPDQGFWNV